MVKVLILILLLTSSVMADDIFYTYYTLVEDIHPALSNDLATKSSRPFNNKQPSLNTEILILTNTNYALIRTDSPKGLLPGATKIVPVSKTTIVGSPRGEGKDVIQDDWRTDPLTYSQVPQIAFNKVWEASGAVKVGP